HRRAARRGIAGWPRLSTGSHAVDRPTAGERCCPTAGFGRLGRDARMSRNRLLGRGWAYLGLNQGPPACEAGALPLSYTPGKRPGMLADGGCAPAEPAPPRTEWEGFEPSRRVNPAHAISSRAPSAARTPLQAIPSIAWRS